jgi:hypothetical protein
MKAGTIALTASIVIALAAILSFHLKQLEGMKNQPKVVEVDSFDMDYILRENRNVVSILGTGSMRPLIPAGKPTEIVAWAVLDSTKDFNLLEAGMVVVFSHKNGTFVIHELSMLDKDGWISSGSYNGFYDSGRVTRENLRGVVTLIYKLKK